MHRRIRKAGTLVSYQALLLWVVGACSAADADGLARSAEGESSPSVEQLDQPVHAGTFVSDRPASLQDPVLAPEGLRMGMPIADAKARVASLGYQPGPAAGCRFTRPIAGGGGRIELALTITDVNPPKEAFPDLAVPELGCGENMEDRFIVSELSYKEYVTRAGESVEPLAEIERIADRLGPYDRCQRLTAAAANTCEWRAPAADPGIKTVRVTISRSWGREYVVGGELLEILPMIPDREGQARVIERQALTICENDSGSETYRALTNCACVANNVARAYARGRIDDVDASTLGGYSDNCPSSRDRLAAFFEERCYAGFGAMLPNWAGGGGCRCAGEKGAEAYLSDPRSSFPNLTGVSSSTVMACGYAGSDARSVVPAEYRGGGSDASASNASSRSAATSEYDTVGETPSGFRPLELWLSDARPVVLESYDGLTARDQTFDYSRQERALPRYLNLLLLANEPRLLDDEPDAARILAGENLADGDLEEFLVGCDRRSSPGSASCIWAGRDEFERRAARQRFVDRVAPSLGRMGQPPRELVYVRRAQLGDYDAVRGGFPLRVSGAQGSGDQGLRQFTLAKESLFGWGDGLIEAIPEPAVAYPEIWRMSETEAEALVERLSTRVGGRSNRFVMLAWIHRIVRIDPPRREYARAKRDFIVEPLAIRLYADARLTDQIGELAADGGPIRSDRTDAVRGGTAQLPGNDAGGGQSVMVIPPRFETVGERVLVHPVLAGSNPVRESNARYFNLLLLKEDPGLVEEPAAALKLAHQNLVGLTASSRRWAGATEFERRRAEKAFRDEGMRRVIELSQGFTLPQEVVIRRRATLDAYDFDRKGFPIRLGNDGLDRVSGFSARDDFGRDTRQGVLVAHRDLAVGPLVASVEWVNSAGPTFWRVAISEAQSLVANRPARNDQRTIYVGTMARLRAVRYNSEGRPIFEGELLKVGLHWDPDLKEEAVSLPVTR